MNNFDLIRNLIQEDKLEEALKLVNKLDNSEKLEGIILKSKILEKKGDFKSALSLINSVLDVVTPQSDARHTFLALVQKSSLLWGTSKYDGALKIISEAEKILNQLNESTRNKVVDVEGDLFNIKGSIFLSSGNLDLALEYQEQSLKIREKIDDKKSMAANLNNIGVINIHKGAISEALSYFKKCLSIFELINEKNTVAFILNNIGGIYQNKGNPNKALFYYEQSLDLSGKLSNKSLTSKILNNIGNVYYERGDYDKSLEYYENSLAIKVELDNEHAMAISYHNIGKIYHAKGDFLNALKQYELSLDINTKIGNNIECSNNILELILLCLDLNMENQAKEYFHKLTKIKNQSDIPIINLYYKFAKALILISTGLFVFRIYAETILGLIVTDEILNHEITVLALIYLCEIKLKNCKIFHTEGIIKKTEQLSDQIYKIAQKQNSFSLLIDSLILKSKFAILQENVRKAGLLLEQADLIVKEQKLTKLQEKVTIEQNRLNKNLEIYSRSTDGKETIIESVERLHLYEHIISMSKASV